MSNVMGLPPRRETRTVTAFHRMIRADELGAGDMHVKQEVMAAAWAALLESVASCPLGEGARIHVKIEVERPI